MVVTVQGDSDVVSVVTFNGSTNCVSSDLNTMYVAPNACFDQFYQATCSSMTTFGKPGCVAGSEVSTSSAVCIPAGINSFQFRCVSADWYKVSVNVGSDANTNCSSQTSVNASGEFHISAPLESN